MAQNGLEVTMDVWELPWPKPNGLSNSKINVQPGRVVNIYIYAKLQESNQFIVW